jgi:hypothetical protein
VLFQFRNSARPGSCAGPARVDDEPEVKFTRNQSANRVLPDRLSALSRSEILNSAPQPPNALLHLVVAGVVHGLHNSAAK